MKKVLSLVLVIALVLSSMVTAFAAPTDIADNDYEKAINALVAFGIINGYEDGTFKPAKEIKRAEIAKILVEALGYGDIAAGAKSSFSDTQNHWADKWIAIAAGTNLVTGYPDGTFKPEKVVTYDEILTMVVRALGYTDSALKGAWPTNYKVKALDLGLTKNVKMATAGADRGGVAQVIYNALEAFLVEVDADNKVSNIVLTQDKDGKVIYKTLVDQLGTRKEITVKAINLDEDSKEYLGAIVDLAPYMYQDLTVYTNKDGDVVYVKANNSEIVEGTVTTDDGSKFIVEDSKDKKHTIEVTSKTAILLNGEEIAYSDVKNLDPKTLEDAKVTVVYNEDKDGKEVLSGIVAKLATDTVQADEEYVKDEVELGSITLPVNDKKVDKARLTVTGDATSLEDIEEDDVLALYYGKGLVNKDRKLEINVTRKTVEGKVTRVNKDFEITISGNVYKPFEESTTEVKVGDEIVIFLTQDGKVFDYVFVDAKVADDYAVVLEVTDGYERVNNGKATRLAEPKIKLLTADGEKITYVIDDESKDVKVIASSVVDGDRDLKVDYTPGQLVEYGLDGKEVDFLKVVGEAKANVKTSGNSFNIVSNAPIFNLKAEGDVDNAKVVKVDDLKDSVSASVVRKDGKIVAMLVFGSVGAEDGIYALVVSNSATALNDDDKAVAEYVTFVDGKKVTYLGNSKTIVDNTTPSGILVELTVEGGKLVKSSVVKSNDKIVVTNTVNKLKAEDKRVTNSIIAGGKTLYLTNDVVVYVVEDGDVTLGSKTDIRGNEFVAYNLDAENTDDYGIVVVFK